MLQPTAVVSVKREADPLLIERMKNADQLELEQMGRIFAPQLRVRSVEPLSKSR